MEPNELPTGKAEESRSPRLLLKKGSFQLVGKCPILNRRCASIAQLSATSHNDLQSAMDDLRAVVLIHPSCPTTFAAHREAATA